MDQRESLTGDSGGDQGTQPAPEAFKGAWNAAYPRTLRDREEALLRRRRQGAGVRDDGPAIGLALSGGGIRSATFGLGVLQGLARRRHLGWVDYLSTVSGGGYIGAFLGRLYTRRQVESVDHVRAILDSDEAVDEISEGPADAVAGAGGSRFAPGQVFRWLRENGRHLAPNGAGDLILGGTVILRNFLALQVVMLMLLTLLFLALQVPRVVLEAGTGSGWLVIESVLAWLPLGGSGLLWWSPWILAAGGWLVLVVVPLGWSYWVLADDYRGGPEGATAACLGHNLRPIWGLLIALAVFAGAGLWSVSPMVEVSRVVSVFSWVVAAIALVTFFFQGVLRQRTWHRYRLDPLYVARESAPGFAWLARLPMAFEEYARREVSEWLRNGLIVFAILCAVALIDSFGQTLYRVVSQGNLGPWLAALIGGLAAAGAAGRRVAVFLGGTPGGKRATLPMGIAALTAVLVLYLVVLSLVAALAHGIAWGFEQPYAGPESGGLPERALLLLLGALFLAALLSWLFGGTWSFLNRSTLHALYTSRLARAYLGASNPRRVATVGVSATPVREGGDVTHPLPDDDLSLDAYYDRDERETVGKSPWDKGVPLHLINVTVNETVDARSNIQQNDRKGMGLAVGPAGLSTGVRHHVVIGAGRLVKEVFPPALDGGFRVFGHTATSTGYPGEALSLGAWVGISGAAFSTGLGSRTNLAMSLLAGFFNVRTGYWWDSGMPPRDRPAQRRSDRFTRVFEWLFPVQSYLVDEFLARFRGVARQWWYLSDGGHFENLGGYELIRRRLPLMIIVDAEADPDYGFEGLANLVRKARLDFGAEVRFLDDAEIGRTGLPAEVKVQLGSLEMLRRGPWKDEPVPDGAGRSRRRRVFGPPERVGRSLACAALARVRYDHDPERISWLLYLKPALVGDEPADVQHYQSRHPDFPHESTSDQFFDEAQWESYRRLGLHIAEKVLGPAGEGFALFLDPMPDSGVPAPAGETAP
jgi:hypothetical protein